MRVVESIARWVASGAQKAAFSDGSVQQNAEDGNTQGSPFGRFAWPCVFSSPALYFLPAERDYRDISDFFAFKGETIYAVLTWLLIVFPNCPLFLYSHEFIRQLYFEHLHLTVDHRLGNLRIGLRRGDAFMPQHLRERFQRHAVHQADRRGIGMASDMKGQLLFDAAQGSDPFQGTVDRIQMRHKRKDIIRAVPVTFQNGQGSRQQFDHVPCVRLAAVACDPPVTVRILFELFPCKGFQIRVADARKTGEEEQVADHTLFLRAERGMLKREDLFLVQESTLRRGFVVTVRGERIAGHDSVVEGDFDHIDQAVQITADARKLEIAFRSQVNMELFDKGLFQFGKGDVAHTVFYSKERLQVFHRGKITVPRVFRTVDADTAVQVVRKAAESGQQGAVTLPESQPGVLHLLGRHIAFPVADIPIMTVELRADIVQMAVDTVGFETPPLGTAAADFPQTLRNRELRTELRNSTVDRDAAHEGNRRLCFFLVPFQVEQNLECAAHNSAFLGIQN